MRRSNKKRPESLKERGVDHHSSPTIQNLIEQLGRDLKESRRKATKAH